MWLEDDIGCRLGEYWISRGSALFWSVSRIRFQSSPLYSTPIAGRHRSWCTCTTDVALRSIYIDLRVALVSARYRVVLVVKATYIALSANSNTYERLAVAWISHLPWYTYQSYSSGPVITTHIIVVSTVFTIFPGRTFRR